MKKTIAAIDNVYEDILVANIETEGQSVREAQDDDHVVELAMSIAKHGLLEPIVVRRTNGDRYQLLAGFHRLAAFTRLGRERIPAHIMGNAGAPVKALALVENICRKDMSLNEEVEAVAYLHASEQLSISQICDTTGKSTAWVQRRLSIPNMPEDVKRELMDGVISIAHAEVLANVEPQNVRAIVLNQAIAGKLTARQTQDLATLYMDTPTIQSAIEEGLQKAQEMEAQKTPTRRCDIGGEITRLDMIQFVAVCPDCLAAIQAALLNQTEKNEVHHGD